MCSSALALAQRLAHERRPRSAPGSAGRRGRGASSGSSCRRRRRPCRPAARDRPRSVASRAMPAPLMPAPITIRSNGRSKVRGGRGARISVPPFHRTSEADVSRYVAAIDQGTSSSRCILFDRDGAVAGSAQREHAQILSARRLGRARPARDRRERAGGGRRGGRGGRRERRPTWRRSGSPTSARRRCCGTARRASRSTTRSSGRTRAPRALVRAAGGDGGPRPACARSRASRSPPTSPGPKVALAARRRPGAAARARRPATCCSGRSTRALIWHAHRRAGRRRARHRRDEREPHAADGPADARLVRRGARPDRHPARDAAGDPLLLGGLRRRCAPAPRSTASRSPASSATSRRRCSGRPASPRARRRTRTGRAASCSSTPARRRSPRRSC